MFEKRQLASFEHVSGGYRHIGVRALYAVWWAYKQGRLRFQDVRVYLAQHEMVSRRCVMSKGRVSQFSFEELGRLVGCGSERMLRASVRRLDREQVSTWNANGISFNDFNELSEARATELEQAMAPIANRRRRVPVPRRTIRWLAATSGPALLATVLAHLFRCVYSRGKQLAAEGSIASGWVAEVFGLDPRNVKRARAKLRALGWLTDRRVDHWHRQRYGGRVVVNLHWQADWSSKVPHPRTKADTNVPHPDTNKKLPMESKNRKPTNRTPDVRTPQRRSKKSPSPSLRNIQAEDLKDVGRILNLHVQAQREGLVGGSESETLQFVAAAVRASNKASRNPGGFLWAVIRKQLWHHITAHEEDSARLMLRRHLHGPDVRTSPKHLEPKSASNLAADVRLVAHVTHALADRGFTGDAFDLLAKEDPRWTRERWDQAMRAWLTPTACLQARHPSLTLSQTFPTPP